MKNCESCGKVIEKDSIFCRFRGKEQSVKAMKTPTHYIDGTWRVTTEGDCEGRSTRDLGVYKGNIDEIARNLADRAEDTLRFEPYEIKKPISKSDKAYVDVTISLPEFSYTNSLTKEEKVILCSDWLKDRPVTIKKGIYGDFRFSFSTKKSK